MDERLSVSEVRAQFAELVNRAAYGGERIVVTRRGKPVAAIVAAEDLAYLEEIEDRYDLELIAAARAEAGPEGTVDLDEYERRRVDRAS